MTAPTVDAATVAQAVRELQLWAVEMARLTRDADARARDEEAAA